MENNQKKAFLEYEADLWFERNKKVVENYKIEEDLVFNLLKKYDISPEKILEIGCSSGYRLNGLKGFYPNADIYGIDPSNSAIAYGKELYPHVHFDRATADQLPYLTKQFDLVIVGFVFYVIDRELLLSSISEIDRVLSDKGFLIIVDFFSEKSLKNEYAHISDFKAYSFKQKYESIFTETHLYQLMDKSTVNHQTRKPDVLSDFYDLMSITLLKKDIHAPYK
jgi:ubiquinone/menaquinone biosynthesis C-methylase UbiE